MKKFNWEGKTGITETQWAQVAQAILWIIVYKLGFQEFAIYAAPASTIILGGLGKILRAGDKKKKTAKIAFDRLNTELGNKVYE